MSRDISTAFSLIAATVVFLLVLPWSMQPLFRLMQGLIGHVDQIRIRNMSDMQHLGGDVMLTMALALAVPTAVLVTVGISISIAQTEGLLWATEKLKPNLDVLNPINGFKKLFGGKALIEFLKGIAKVAIVGTAAYLVIKPEVLRVTLLVGMTPEQMLPTIIDNVRRLLYAVILTILVIGALDYFYQKWSSLQGLKMTKQEVKDEHKNTEGDPFIKGKHKQMRMSRAKKRMLQSVPKASVVITNPTHYAVALHYEVGAMGAPRVVAKGVDFMAQRIREIAMEHDVPIVENPPVARALYATVELDEEISTDHYKAVAEIIGYVMKLRRWKAA